MNGYEILDIIEGWIDDHQLEGNLDFSIDDNIDTLTIICKDL